MIEQPSSTPEEHTRHYDIATIVAQPLGTTKWIEAFFKAAIDSGSRAVIVTGFANGTVPQGFFPSIEDTVGKGVPVFVISDNRAEDKGPQRVKYDVQAQLIGTGASILTNANVNHAWDVADAIQDAIEQGLAGEELNQAVTEVFGVLAINAK